MLIAAQFCSALADNALLLVAIAFLEQTGSPGWWAPLLKFCFTVAYVVLAPVVGPLADSMPKARLMAWMNGLKMAGVVALCGGLHPWAAFGIVGLGAAAYAPAKYGLITEIVPPRDLVRANAWLEVSVVGAVLLGAVLGGLLVGGALTGLLPAGAHSRLAAWGVADGTTLGAAFVLLLAVYALSALLNLRVRDSGVRYARQPVHPVALVRQFVQANTLFWRDTHGGRLSLCVTTLFWGVGAVLQFAVLRLAADRLGLPLSQGAYLQAVVAVGVVAGAAYAGRHIALAAVPRVLPAGALLGLLVLAGAAVTSVGQAVPLLALVGIVGGILVVPMNALLQHRGLALLSSGRSIAVQGFNENLAILLGLAVYAALLHRRWTIVEILALLGGLLALFMATLTARHTAAARRASQS